MPPLMGIGALMSGLGGLGSIFGGMQGAKDNQGAFDDLIGFMNKRTKKELGLVDQWSGQNVLDTQRDWDNRLGQLAQSQISRGVTGSTIGSSEQLAGQREASADIRRSKDEYLKLKLAAYGATTGDTAKVWSGWNSPQPNYGGLAQAGQGFGMGIGSFFGGGNQNPYSMTDWMSGKGV